MFALGWMIKRRHHLLICASIIGILWLFFFYYYNYRTLSVSPNSLLHVHTDRHSGRHTESEDRDHMFTERKHLPENNNTWKHVSDASRIDSHVKENRALITGQLPAKLHQNPYRPTRSSEFSKTVNLGQTYGRSHAASKDDIRHFHSSALDHNAANLSPTQTYRFAQDLLKDQKSSISDLEHHSATLQVPSQPKPVHRPLKQSSDLLLSSGFKASGTFEFDVEHTVDNQKRIVVSVVDAGYVNFAVNFQRTSVDVVGLKNFLFVCTDREAVMALRQHGIACTIFRQSRAIQNVLAGRAAKKTKSSAGTASASDFGTEEYYQKSNSKTAVVLDLLKRGCSVLIVDPDVILFKDPFPYFNCSECDAYFQMDRDMYNSGFAYIRATPASVRLYQSAWDFYMKYHKAHDQAYINMAIDRLNSPNTRVPAVRIQSLSSRLFPCGIYYFEHQHRMFANNPPCPECVMMHNNYIGSVAAKIYRAKENLMWSVDDNGYYTNSSVRYITYENPHDFGPNTTRYELEALRSALAVAVASGRVLILPTFHCCSGCVPGSHAECSHPRFRCSLLSLLRITRFDRVFGSRYREHSFLSNSLVPERVRWSVSSRVLFINSSSSGTEFWRSLNKTSVDVLSAANFSRGADLTEVVRWIYRHNRTSVIRFHSLYGNSVNWAADAELGGRLKRWFDVAFDCSEYEQWDSSMMNMAKMWPGNRLTNQLTI